MSTFTAKAFNDFLAQGKLMGSHCSQCDHTNLPPRQVCQKCGSDNLEWRELKGDGFLEAITLNKMPSSSFKQRCPFPVGIVKLVEGPSISGMIFSDNEESLKIGTKVMLSIIKEGEKPLLGFKTI